MANIAECHLHTQKQDEAYGCTQLSASSLSFIKVGMDMDKLQIIPLSLSMGQAVQCISSLSMPTAHSEGLNTPPSVSSPATKVKE